MFVKLTSTATGGAVYVNLRQVCDIADLGEHSFVTPVHGMGSIEVNEPAREILRFLELVDNVEEIRETLRAAEGALIASVPPAGRLGLLQEAALHKIRKLLYGGRP